MTPVDGLSGYGNLDAENKPVCAPSRIHPGPSILLETELVLQEGRLNPQGTL